MKIAVIGNSHIGAIKRGWDQLRSAHDGFVEVVFFGHRGGAMRGLRVEDNRLVPDNSELRQALAFTSGGHTFIEPADFDIILLHGLGITPLILDEESFYSKQTIRLALQDTVQHTVGFKVLRRIRQISEIPVYIGHTPLPVARGPVRPREISNYLAGIRLVNEEIMPKDAELLPQPAETIVNGRWTDRRYSQGSRRLAVGDELDDRLHRDNEANHMNEAFGALFLNSFFAKIHPAARSLSPEPRRVEGLRMTATSPMSETLAPGHRVGAIAANET